MKTFKELLAESTKTYAVRVKIAGDLPEGFEAKFKDYMTKYETVEFKKVGSTPVQEHPHEFPRIKNKEVAIYDVETSYPISFPQLEGVLAEQFGLEMDNRANIKALESNYKTNIQNVFVAGDQRRGQSLIVWAISEGRQAAHHVDKFLMGESNLPLKGEGDLPRV